MTVNTPFMIILMVSVIDHGLKKNNLIWNSSPVTFNVLHLINFFGGKASSQLFLSILPSALAECKNTPSVIHWTETLPLYFFITYE